MWYRRCMWCKELQIIASLSILGSFIQRFAIIGAQKCNRKNFLQLLFIVFIWSRFSFQHNMILENGWSHKNRKKMPDFSTEIWKINHAQRKKSKWMVDLVLFLTQIASLARFQMRIACHSTIKIQLYSVCFVFKSSFVHPYVNMVILYVIFCIFLCVCVSECSFLKVLRRVQFFLFLAILT